MNERYQLTAPVKGGNQWWSINDTKKNMTVASISAQFPNAEVVARELLQKVREGC